MIGGLVMDVYILCRNNTHLLVEVAVEECHKNALQSVHGVEEVIVQLLQVTVLRVGADQCQQELDAEQGNQQDCGPRHPPTEREFGHSFVALLNVLSPSGHGVVSTHA